MEWWVEQQNLPTTFWAFGILQTLILKSMNACNETGLQGKSMTFKMGNVT